MQTQSQQFYLAVACVLFSAAMWGIIWYPMRLFDASGLTVLWATLIMYLMALVWSLPAFWRARRRDSHVPVELMGLAVAAGLTNLTFLVALNEGEVMRVMLLFFLSPLWSVLLSRLWLKEKISELAMIMLLIAMSGSVIMLWRPEFGFPWPDGRADWLALFAGVMFSVNNVISRKLGYMPLAVKSTVVYFGVVVVALVVIALRQPAFPDASLWVWGQAGVIGGLMITAMTVSVLYGLAHMAIYRSAVLMLFELVVAALSAWWLTSEHMSQAEWIGGALIFLAAYGIAQAEKLRAATGLKQRDSKT